MTKLTPAQTQLLIEQCSTDPVCYRKFVLNLASNPGNYNLSNPVVFGLLEALDRLTPSSLELDHFKRAMTYGEKLRINPSAYQHPVAPQIAGAVYNQQHGYALNTQQADHLLLIHAVLGKITEALELAPILKELLTTGECDVTNLVEELGDDAWYTALAEHVMAVEPGYVIRRNVSKLAKRYEGGVFTREEAISRDLDAERAALGDDGKGNDALGEDQ